jgi:Mg-chelatase subunit ChlD
MKSPFPRTATAFVLQALALAALLLALVGVRWLDDRSRPTLLVLVDRSSSVPRVDADAALVELRRAAPGHRLEWLQFAGRAGLPAPLPTDAVEMDARARDAGEILLPSVTNLEQALDAALAAHAHRPYAAAVVLSDGRANAGDASRALSSAREAGLPIRWLTVARSAPVAWIEDVQAPARARRGQALGITVPLAGDTSRPLRVTATARDAGGSVVTTSATPDERGVARLELEPGRGGPLLVSLSLEDTGSGKVLEQRRDAAAIDVVEEARLLYLQGSPGSLAHSLRGGGWALETAPARRAEAYRERLGGFEAVVLDDVAIEDASAAFWRALADEVTRRGLGLLMLGGERSFARGGYRDSVLEPVLPVLSEPAALDQPASIVFAVDKSGSMGEGSGGVNRLGLAQRAVLETARTLAARDSAGLVVFDVEPRVLLPITPAGEATQRLAADWPVQARGGTRLAPAIELAVEQLEAVASGRRMLVVVTDGFVDDAPLEALRRRVEEARVEVVALAIGPDADASALARLVSPGNGVVLRVGEAAELPRAMSAGLERRRARIERGEIEVEPRPVMPLLAGAGVRWPDVAAYAVTRLRPEASMWLQSREGDPVIAGWQAGAGRVVTVTSGLGPWTPQWLSWKAWPDLAGGLADWVSGSSGVGRISLVVSDAPDGLVVEADLQADGRWAAAPQAALSVVTPGGRSRSIAMRPVAPGRLGATVPEIGPGAYTLVVSGPAGMQRALHLRDDRAEQDGWGEDPEVERWVSEGLVQRWDPSAGGSADLRAAATAVRPDRWLVGLALLLFCAGVVVDRLPRRFGVR